MDKNDTVIPDLVFTFKKCKVDIDIDNDIFDEDEIKKITQAVKVFSKEISIDKSFVGYAGTKYVKTFILEDGWKNLCKIAFKAHCNKKFTKEEYFTLYESYKLLIVFYIYQCLEDIGYDVEGINLEVKKNSNFISNTTIDTYQEWKRYPGKWQTW